MKRFISILILISMLFPLMAQSSSSDSNKDEPILDLTPVPYTDEEFPQWTKDLRRGEIIFFGSAPFSFLFTAVGYRSVKYAYNNITASAGDVVPGWNDLEQDDQKNMIYIGLGLSLTIAVIDFFLGKIQKEEND
ncbi:MAG: hypothetical protein JEY99_00685 [Spirochaetales bacterium]|nr:hypothetical protein [Spirochaetales bacterium]